MKLIVAILAFLIPTISHAWDGYDYDRGSYVEIGKGNLVRPGQDIERLFDVSCGFEY